VVNSVITDVLSHWLATIVPIIQVSVLQYPLVNELKAYQIKSISTVSRLRYNIRQEAQLSQRNRATLYIVKLQSLA